MPARIICIQGVHQRFKSFVLQTSKICRRLLICFNTPQMHFTDCHFKLSAPEPSGTSQGICTRNLQNLTEHLLRQNPPEPHKVSAPEPSGTSQPHRASSPPKPSGTSQGLCTRTLRNLTRYLPRNPPEPHHASSPRPSGTSSGSCTGNFRNLTRYLHQNPIEPNQVSAP